jgi:hypothetical protein
MLLFRRTQGILGVPCVVTAYGHLYDRVGGQFAASQVRFMVLHPPSAVRFGPLDVPLAEDAGWRAGAGSRAIDAHNYPSDLDAAAERLGERLTVRAAEAGGGGSAQQLLLMSALEAAALLVAAPADGAAAQQAEDSAAAAVEQAVRERCARAHSVLCAPRLISGRHVVLTLYAPAPGEADARAAAGVELEVFDPVRHSSALLFVPRARLVRVFGYDGAAALADAAAAAAAAFRAGEPAPTLTAEVAADADKLLQLASLAGPASEPIAVLRPFGSPLLALTAASSGAASRVASRVASRSSGGPQRPASPPASPLRAAGGGDSGGAASTLLFRRSQSVLGVPCIVTAHGHLYERAGGQVRRG